MVQDTQKEIEPYISYDFQFVKCGDCGVNSDPFVRKEHLTPDELLAYIEDIAKFYVDHDKGGLRCRKCDRKNRLLRRKKCQEK